MVNKLSDIITDFYIKKKIIEYDEKDVYKYGIELIINDIITFSLIIIISAMFFNIRYAIEFLTVFCSTRVYCGGYHAPKTYLCRLTMFATFISVTTLSMILKNTIQVITAYTISVILLLIILPIIPIKHPNKELNEKTIKKGKRNGVILYIIFIICSAIIFKYINNRDGLIICLSLCAVSVLAIKGYKRYEKEV